MGLEQPVVDEPSVSSLVSFIGAIVGRSSSAASTELPPDEDQWDCDLGCKFVIFVRIIK
jgi:hypothetical protein